MKIKLVLLALLAAAGLTHAGSPGTAPLKTAVNPGHLADTRAYGYSQATVVAPGARVIYIAGQVGVAADGPNDFETQVDRAFDNLLAVLAAAGGRVDDIVKITLLVKHHDAARLDYLKAQTPPDVRRESAGEHVDSRPGARDRCDGVRDRCNRNRVSLRFRGELAFAMH